MNREDARISISKEIYLGAKVSREKGDPPSPEIFTHSLCVGFGFHVNVYPF